MSSLHPSIWIDLDQVNTTTETCFHTEKHMTKKYKTIEMHDNPKLNLFVRQNKEKNFHENPSFIRSYITFTVFDLISKQIR